MEGINTPFVIDEHTAIVMTDPQNDFLSENGLGWGAFGENIQKNGTVENLRRIFEVAAAKGMLVFISPHYYYKHDHQWLFEGPIEKLMHDTGMFCLLYTSGTPIVWRVCSMRVMVSGTLNWLS